MLNKLLIMISDDWERQSNKSWGPIFDFDLSNIKLRKYSCQSQSPDQSILFETQGDATEIEAKVASSKYSCKVLFASDDSQDAFHNSMDEENLPGSNSNSPSRSSLKSSRSSSPRGSLQPQQQIAFIDRSNQPSPNRSFEGVNRLSAAETDAVCSEQRQTSNKILAQSDLQVQQDVRPRRNR